MTLRTNLTDADAQSTLHAAQHNEVNTDVIALQSASAAIPADSNGATTATVTPDPVSAAHSMNVVVVPANQAVLAVKISGDTYPRWILTADPYQTGLTCGDGTFDPLSAASSFGYDTPSTGVFMTGKEEGGIVAGSQSSAVTSTHHLHGASMEALGSIVIGKNLEGGGAGGSTAISAGSGAPNIGGAVGDIYIRSDGGALTTIYRCTVAGNASGSTWVGIL